MDKRDKAVKDVVDFLSNFEVSLPTDGSIGYRWVKKEDNMKKKEAYDPKLTLTYEGGCPSRFCYPKGYHRAKERKVTMNMAGATYDGIANREKEYLSELPPHVLKLMVAIEERKK